MAFNLVVCGDDSGFFEKANKLCFAKVGDADCFCLAALERLLHGFPCINIISVACFNFVVLLGYEAMTSGKWGGPVHEVEV